MPTAVGPSYGMVSSKTKQSLFSNALYATHLPQLLKLSEP